MNPDTEAYASLGIKDSKKLVIDEIDNTCKGVTVITASGEELTFYATREVIVSQGVFESPKLLMLSGIGPQAELKKHNIPVLVDSPHVGQHLLDHPGVPFVLEVKEGYGMDDYVLRQGTPHHNCRVVLFNLRELALMTGQVHPTPHCCGEVIVYRDIAFNGAPEF